MTQAFAICVAADPRPNAAIAGAAEKREALPARLLNVGTLCFPGFDLRTFEGFGRLVDASSNDAPRSADKAGASLRRALIGSSI